MRTAVPPDRGSLLLISIILVIVVMGFAGACLVVSEVGSRRLAKSEEGARALVAEGNIVMQGSPYLEAFFNEAELLVAGGDVYARGTGANDEIDGLILAHEQVDLSGNILLHGRILAESAVNSAESPVGADPSPLLSQVGGNVLVT